MLGRLNYDIDDAGKFTVTLKFEEEEVMGSKVETGSSQRKRLSRLSPPIDHVMNVL